MAKQTTYIPTTLRDLFRPRRVVDKCLQKYSITALLPAIHKRRQRRSNLKRSRLFLVVVISPKHTHTLFFITTKTPQTKQQKRTHTLFVCITFCRARYWSCAAGSFFGGDPFLRSLLRLLFFRPCRGGIAVAAVSTVVSDFPDTSHEGGRIFASSSCEGEEGTTTSAVGSYERHWRHDPQ